MGELADLLMTTQEAKDDMEAQKKALKTAEKKKEEGKERMGQVLVDMETKREAADDAGSVVISDDDDTEEPESARKKRKKRNSGFNESGETEMRFFGLSLRDAGHALVELESKRLSFEQERTVADRIERERER